MGSLITQPVSQGDSQVTAYRRAELLRLGFSVKEADRLSPMSWHEFNIQDARRLLSQGATHSQCMKLLLPL